MKLKELYTQFPLFHGSIYLTNTLRPGITYTCIKQEWDETESNEFLYASTIKQEAINNAIAHYCETNFIVDRISFDDKSFTIYTPNPKDIIISNVVVYLYTITSGTWELVNNQYNGSNTEYKTKDFIAVNTPETISNPLKNKKVVIKATPEEGSWS